MPTNRLDPDAIAREYFTDAQDAPLVRLAALAMVELNSRGLVRNDDVQRIGEVYERVCESNSRSIVGPGWRAI